MIVPLVCIFIVFMLLCGAELLARKQLVRGEASRKLVHIVVGTFVALWPLLMSLEKIQFISLAFVVVIVLSRQFRIFRSIHNTRRQIWGELFFAASIGLLPLISSSRLVFVAAVLHMSLADGLAGLIGTRYGSRSRFLMFGQPKSVLGSVTFAITSYAIVLGFFKASKLVGVNDLNAVVLALPLLATFLETASVKGSDNILVPIIVGIVLQSTLP